MSVGEAVQAMILIAPGFVGRAVHLTPEFFDNKPVGLLIREVLTAEDFESISKWGLALWRKEYETALLGHSMADHCSRKMSSPWFEMVSIFRDHSKPGARQHCPLFFS